MQHYLELKTQEGPVLVQFNKDAASMCTAAPTLLGFSAYNFKRYQQEKIKTTVNWKEDKFCLYIGYSLYLYWTVIPLKISLINAK